MRALRVLRVTPSRTTHTVTFLLTVSTRRMSDPQNPHAGKIPEIQPEYFIFLENSVRIFFIAVAGIYSVAREPALTPRHEPDPDDPEPVFRGRPPRFIQPAQLLWWGERRASEQSSIRPYRAGAP